MFSRLPSDSRFPFISSVQINEPNAYGNTPLHVACYNGQDVVVNELIECGAKVNRVNDKGFAPLHFTASSRHGALCLELLVCNGADVNIEVSAETPNKNRKTAIAAPFCFQEEWERTQQSRITLSSSCQFASVTDTQHFHPAANRDVLNILPSLMSVLFV